MPDEQVTIGMADSRAVGVGSTPGLVLGEGRLTMDDEKAAGKKPKGTVFVQAEICKGCSYCIDLCPTDCLEFSKGFNSKGYHYPLLARPEDCTGCDLCGLYCPDFAIFGMKFKDLEARRNVGVLKGAAG